MSSGSYRYGFNGKENDNEVKDLGEQQDYGMRIYDPRLGRFLSADPIMKEYPQLTPYQFASNRPIDGIDQDGLEYLTYTIVIDLNASGGSKVMNSTYIWHNAKQHNSHGKLGQGVLYNIRFYNSKEKQWLGEYSSFVSRGASKLGVPTEYGNYLGATGLYKIDNEGHFSNTYDYDLAPVDFVDNRAKSHDMGYDALRSVGENGLFQDWGTTPVDEAALNGWNYFLANYEIGDSDPYNGQPVTKSERGAASRAATLFSIVIGNKKSDISNFMQRNYRSEARKPNSKGQAIQDGNSIVEHNYQLFLNKYMQKDGDGNWTRKEDMWSKDKQGN